MRVVVDTGFVVIVAVACAVFFVGVFGACFFESRVFFALLGGLFGLIGGLLFLSAGAVVLRGEGGGRC